MNELLKPATWKGFKGIVKGSVVSEEASPKSPAALPFMRERCANTGQRLAEARMRWGGVGVGPVVRGLFSSLDRAVVIQMYTCDSTAWS